MWKLRILVKDSRIMRRNFPWKSSLCTEYLKISAETDFFCFLMILQFFEKKTIPSDCVLTCSKILTLLISILTSCATKILAHHHKFGVVFCSFCDLISLKMRLCFFVSTCNSPHLLTNQPPKRICPWTANITKIKNIFILFSKSEYF